MSANGITRRECLAQTHAAGRNRSCEESLGSSSTLISVDPAGNATAVFLTQFMPGVGASGDAVAYRGEFNAAIDADLRA